MPPSSKTAIVLLSGGLDSVLSATLASQEITLKEALTFDYGQRAFLREVRAAKSFSQKWNLPHQVIPLPWLKDLTQTALVNRKRPLPMISEAELNTLTITQKTAKDVWVPNRNGIFLNVAAAFAESKGYDSIVTGFNVEEGTSFPDNSSEAVVAANRFFEWTTLRHTTVKSWVQDMTKETMVHKGISLHLDFGELWSCYEGGEKMCGVCESCLRSIHAYKKNNIWEKMRRNFLEAEREK